MNQYPRIRFINEQSNIPLEKLRKLDEKKLSTLFNEYKSRLEMIEYINKHTDRPIGDLKIIETDGLINLYDMAKKMIDTYNMALTEPDKFKWQKNPCNNCSPGDYIGRGLRRTSCSFCGRGK